jgi:hypothetical protein
MNIIDIFKTCKTYSYNEDIKVNRELDLPIETIFIFTTPIIQSDYNIDIILEGYINNSKSVITGIGLRKLNCFNDVDEENTALTFPNINNFNFSDLCPLVDFISKEIRDEFKNEFTEDKLYILQQFVDTIRKECHNT